MKGILNIIEMYQAHLEALQKALDENNHLKAEKAKLEEEIGKLNNLVTMARIARDEEITAKQHFRNQYEQAENRNAEQSRSIHAMSQEIAELKGWKAQALVCLPKVEEIAPLFGWEVGVDCHRYLVPSIKAVLRKLLIAEDALRFVAQCHPGSETQSLAQDALNDIAKVPMPKSPMERFPETYGEQYRRPWSEKPGENIFDLPISNLKSQLLADLLAKSSPCPEACFPAVQVTTLGEDAQLHITTP